MSHNNEKEPKIKFVENLTVVASAISLGWIREIHIDKKYEHHKHLSKIIAHERKHQEYYDRCVAEKNPGRQSLIQLQNNIWDFLSIWKLTFYLDIKFAIAETTMIGAATFFLLKQLILG